MYLLELPAPALTRFGRELPSPKELGEAASSMLSFITIRRPAGWGTPSLTVVITYALKYASLRSRRVPHRARLLPSAPARCLERFLSSKRPKIPFWTSCGRTSAISFSLRKRFWWQEAVLWVEDLKGRKCDVFLSSKDDIVPSASVVDYLKDTDVGVHNLGETRPRHLAIRRGRLPLMLFPRRSRCDGKRTKNECASSGPGDDVSIVYLLRSSLPDPERLLCLRHEPGVVRQCPRGTS